MKIFSVYDNKAKFFMTPFYSRTVETASREFGIAAKDEGTMFSRHPDDFVLFEIGSFDELNGHIASMDSPMAICSARALISVQGE